MRPFMQPNADLLDLRSGLRRDIQPTGQPE